MTLIDAYAHVGVPRFQSITDYRLAAGRVGVDRAVLCAFDSCPDLAGVHAALTEWPQTYRALGVPLGADRAEMQAAVEAQLAAGFSGLRLTDADVLERPWLLDILAAARGVAIVCGRPSSVDIARTLVSALDRNPSAVVIGGHFAGAADPAVLRDGPVADLFSHPWFSVVFSRHGGYPASMVEPWAAAVVEKIGWGRVMWGSEAPVLFWRNETLPDALRWVDRLSPSAAEQAAFFGGNAQRLYFDTATEPAPLRLPFDPWSRLRAVPATVWAAGLPVRQDIAGRLVHGWLAAGGDDTLADYAEDVLDKALPPLDS